MLPRPSTIWHGCTRNKVATLKLNSFQSGPATTGRARRCGWFDAVLARQACWLNSVTSLCVTKLDVLDGLEEIMICTGYRFNGVETDRPPWDSSGLTRCEPVYESLPGWATSTGGVRSFDHLPVEAKNYLARIESLMGVPIDVISTGADREETVILKNPFGTT